MSALSSLATAVDGPGCEPARAGVLTEPVATITSLAFVIAAVLIPATARRARIGGGTEDQGTPAPSVLAYAVLVAAVGLGSVIQHGPDPAWADLAHDLPLLATLAFVAADALAGLTGRARRWWWWVAPTAVLTPLIVGAPRAGDLAQVGVAAIAVTLTLARARADARVRHRTGWALALLSLGAAIGTLGRDGRPLCVPETVWQGHGAWHVLAAVALLVLAPVIGDRVSTGAGPRPQGLDRVLRRATRTR